MSWRFKASKFKNAAPKVPKAEELVRDLNVGSYQVNGQVIKASASFMTFNADVAGKNALPISLLQLLIEFTVAQEATCMSFH